MEVGAGGGSIARWLSERVGPSGQVVATDIDVRFLEHLTADNIQVRSHDIQNDDLESAAFDLAHCRSLLVHMHTPELVLRQMLAALRPGGWMLAEEPYFEVIAAVDDAHPLAKAFNTTIPVLFRFLSEAGIMHSVFGRSLPTLMEQVGLVEVQNEGVTGIARGGDPESSNWLSVWERLGSYLVDQNVVDQTDLVDTKRALADPTFRYVNGVVFAAWGQRPN